MSNLKDYATSTVSVAPSPATSGTTLKVQLGHGDRFPAAPFHVTAHPPFEFPTLDNAEKLLVTAKSGDEFTITRAQGDTDAQPIEAGWRISNTLFLDDIPVIDATSVESAGAVMETDTSTADMDFVLDEDDMASDSATKLATQQSIKAYVDAAVSAAKQALLPVGSIVVLGVSTNPNTLYGFGTWTAIEDRVIVGKGTAGTFDTLDATGGAETHTLTIDEMPAHNHTVDNRGSFSRSSIAGSNIDPVAPLGGNNANRWDAAIQNWGNTSSSTGGGKAHNNLQPYIVKYMWQRTA